MHSIKGTFYLFAVAGIGLLILTFNISMDTYKAVSTGKVTTGTVVDIVEHRSQKSYSFSPVVRFTTENKKEIQFESSVSSKPSRYQLGDTVSVIYDPVLPQHARINVFFDLWGGSLIAGALALVFSTVGFGMIVSGIIRSFQIRSLLENGQRIEVTVKQVVQEANYRVNRRRPYQIICQYYDGNVVRLLKSDNIWFDPTDYLTQPKIAAYIDPMNPKNTTLIFLFCRN